jgi:hypothetical protein
MSHISAVLVLVAVSLQGQSAPVSWLDRPLANWNTAGASLPSPPGGDESKRAVIARCQLTTSPTTAAHKATAAAGWIPFLYFDQSLEREGVEVVGGMAGSDGMCRPTQYNVFVFVDGRFAGTLSPVLMDSRFDGSSGAVRLPLPNVTAEFARYTPSDPMCCPSSRVTVRYRIDRTPAGALVVPVDIRTTRG